MEVEESESSQDIGIEGEEEMKKKEEFSHSKEEKEGTILNTFKVNTFHSEGIYDMEHTHTEPNEDILSPENGLFIDETPDLFSILFSQGNNSNNTCTSSKPEEEIQALLEEIFEENPWDNGVLSQPQESSTHQEGPPFLYSRTYQNWDINPQTPHVQVNTDEPSNFKVKFPK
ncbi:hypothetical protein O181_085788 [Austropuccinia psidii MF-1]|uniref:Uncharacterized protein n=1 Tax=Austropuccinia psidii MF-1 TaxID=1389203 RepID=A0A9Q3FY74_9BASI|nr:hypothetical protein [Austropuccinia psidii MF-1]